MMVEIHGTCEQRFSKVRHAFEKNFTEGLEQGASIAVTYQGVPVVDLWAGFADEAGTRPWERDTIVNVYSTTKTMTALCALILADRGAIDFHAPVAKYWPEFAQNGKEHIEVRHLMSHSAGLSGWDEQFTAEAMYDWDRMTALLAAQAPWWEPGTASGYHSITQGFLVGEVIRRVSGTTVAKFFKSEVAEPLDADFQIGLSPGDYGRAAELIPPVARAGAGAMPRGEAVRAGNVMVRTFANPPMNARDSATEGWRNAELPAVNGHGNGRSIARIHAVLANGGEAFGHRLLSEAGASRIFEQQVDGADLVLGGKFRFGMGFALNSPDLPISPNPRACFWAGWGGSLAQIDRDARLSIGYAMNRMNSTTVGDARIAEIRKAIYESLGTPIP